LEIGNASYEIRQCADNACRFRYPTVIGEAVLCPVCNGSTVAFALPEVVRRDTAVTTPPPTHHIEVLLDNIRSLHNVGSIFRTADGAGVRHLYLCGITATPQHKKLAKTALGAHTQMSWSYARNGLDTAVSLKSQGWQLWALEETPQAQSLYKINLPPPDTPVLLIIGNENIGIDPAILNICDQVVSLPMYGIKDSLNVSVAFGIAVYHLNFHHVQ
jgi:tRNA G18 (ribose-2'-O)-methylase SpoU